MDTKNLEYLETATEERPLVCPKDPYDKRSVLNLAIALLCIGTPIMFVLGLLFLSANNIVLLVICLILSPVHLLCATLLLCLRSKVPPLPEEERARLRKPTKLRKGIVLGMEAAICLIPLLIFTAQGNSQLQAYAANLQGGVFGAHTDESRYVTYTFETNKTCVRREYDISGYAPVSLAEESLRYSIVGSAETPQLKIHNTRYQTTCYSSQIQSFKDGSTTFRRNTKSDSPVSVYTDFVNRYNTDVMGTVLSTATDSDYIVAAKSALVQHGAIKYPLTVQWHTSQVYQKDRYGRAIVYLDFSCENAFGTPKRYQQYVFIQEVTGSQYRVDTSCYYCDEQWLEIHKTVNGFGEHPNKDRYTGILANKLTTSGFAEVTNEKSFFRYVCNTDLVDIFLYVDGTDNNISAVMVSVNSGKFLSANMENRTLIQEATAAALRQITAAQPAEPVNTGYYSFTRETVTKYLTVNSRVTDFVNSGLIISADVVDGKTVVAVVDGYRYGFTPEDYWTPLGMAAPGSTVSSGGSSTATLSDFLDFEKVWAVDFTVFDFEGSYLYAFSKDGTCHIVISDGCEAIDGGKGTYSIEENTIAFNLVLDGHHYEYSYSFDPSSSILTLLSGKPIMSDLVIRGARYRLREDNENDVAKIRNLAQAFADNQFPDDMS